MSQPYLGQIDMFGGPYAPKGFAFCNGQLMSITQNQALFSVLGVTYGGDGRTTFALPNMQSHLPMHFGQGPGLSAYQLGQNSGTPTVTLSISNMPGHNHIFTATQTIATSTTIANNLLPGQPTDGTPPAFYGATKQGEGPLPPHPLNVAACGMTGGNQSHSNLMPSLCITFIIALQGMFPSRN